MYRGRARREFGLDDLPLVNLQDGGRKLIGSEAFRSAAVPGPGVL